MNNILFKITIFCAAIGLPLLVYSANAENAPSGYSWLTVPDINTRVLLPDGWHYRFNQAKLRGSFVLSREAPELGAGVKTGLTFYIVNNMAKTNARPLGSQIEGYVENLKTRPGNHGFFQQAARYGSFRGVKIGFSNINENSERVIRRLYLANEQTDELVIATFVAPEADWQELQKLSDILFDNLILSP